MGYYSYNTGCSKQSSLIRKNTTDSALCRATLLSLQGEVVYQTQNSMVCVCVGGWMDG